MRIRLIPLFGLVAMVPATLNAAPVAGGTIDVPICTGDGLVHMVRVPVGQSEGQGQGQSGCCVKGCHAGGSRKRLLRKI